MRCGIWRRDSLSCSHGLHSDKPMRCDFFRKRVNWVFARRVPGAYFPPPCAVGGSRRVLRSGITPPAATEAVA